MENKTKFSHSVILDYEKCRGCTTCIRRCPTEAIRVRNGKAVITAERCIDCGECIRICPYKAKKAVYDNFDECIKNFKWSVAVPAPALYGQFSHLEDIDYILTGLINMGFNQVFEVSKAAEIISDYTRQLMKEGLVTTPVISSACPAVVRLVRARFPDLCDNLLPVVAPFNLAATMARKEAVEKTGLRPEEIGIFFISPCAAKVTEGKLPLAIDSSGIDGIFSINDLYPRLLKEMNKITNPMQLSSSGIVGLSWPLSGGESSGLLRDRYLAADGIENVIKVLEEIEKEKLQTLEFIELNACTGGCVGGVLTVENPFVARAKIKKLRKYLPVSKNKIQEDIGEDKMNWQKKITYEPVMELDSDVSVAMKKMRKMDKIELTFPGLDCGACGAPTCRALAEDIVNGSANITDCLFVIRDRLSEMYEKTLKDTKKQEE